MNAQELKEQAKHLWWIQDADEFEKGVYMGRQDERMKRQKILSALFILAALACFYMSYNDILKQYPLHLFGLISIVISVSFFNNSRYFEAKTARNGWPLPIVDKTHSK